MTPAALTPPGMTEELVGPSSDGFVVSTVVISKETPLHDPVKTFRAAIQGAGIPAARMVCSKTPPARSTRTRRVTRS